MTDSRRVRHAILLAAALTVRARQLAAQPAAPVDDPCRTPTGALLGQCLEILREDLSDFRSLLTTTDNAHANPASVTFVESATAIEAWSVAIGNKSSLQGYQFPVTLSVNPFRLFDPYDKRWRQRGIWRSLGQSQLAATYAPVVVQPRSDHVPGVAESAARTVSGSYKIVLRGTREMEDNLEEINDLGNKGLAKALADRQVSDGQQALPGKQVAFDVERSQFLAAALPLLQADLKRQLTVAVKLTYLGDSRPVKPNAFAAELDVSKVLGRHDTPLAPIPISLAGSLSRSWFGRSQAGGTYEQTSAAFGPTVTVTKGLDLTVQGQVDRYSGRGFPGIPGVADLTRRTDIGLAQAVKFKLPININGDLTLSVKELHLGTGNTDVALAALLTLNPGLRHPKKPAQ